VNACSRVVAASVTSALPFLSLALLKLS